LGGILICVVASVAALLMRFQGARAMGSAPDTSYGALPMINWALFLWSLAVSYFRANAAVIMRNGALFALVLFVGLFARSKFELSELFADVIASLVLSIVAYPTLSLIGWIIHVANESKRLGIKIRNITSDPRYKEILEQYK
jgi:hypothetical protein